MHLLPSLLAMFTIVGASSKILGSALPGVQHESITIPLKPRLITRNAQQGQPQGNSLPLGDAFNGTDLQVGNLDDVTKQYTDSCSGTAPFKLEHLLKICKPVQIKY